MICYIFFFLFGFKCFIIMCIYIYMIVSIKIIFIFFLSKNFYKQYLKNNYRFEEWFFFKVKGVISKKLNFGRFFEVSGFIILNYIIKI